MTEPPLAYEPSAGNTHLEICSSPPHDVVQCLQNARFLHLATCRALHPHVSLMNYTYLAESPYGESPAIVMTTNPASKKALNLVANPNVSLLVHDWVSHRPPTATGGGGGGGGGRGGSPPPPEVARSSLASLLSQLNTSALSRISATINGVARVVARGTAEERYLRQKHLENHTFAGTEDVGGATGLLHGSSMANGTRPEPNDGGRSIFIEGDEVRVVVVQVLGGRIADWKGGVRDWTLEERSR